MKFLRKSQPLRCVFLKNQTKNRKILKDADEVMKALIWCAVILSLSLVFLPLLSLNLQTEAVPSQAVLKTEEKVPQKTQTENAETFRVLDTQTQKITEISLEDYLFGVLAAEMPVLYEPEALKAQTVAAYTFACRRKEANQNKDYDITSDHTVDQKFISPEVARSCWGEKSEEYTKKLQDCITAVQGHTVTYKGDLALTVYHAVSSGKTASAEEVWNSEIPYLCSVDSAADKLAKDYCSTVTFSKNEVAEKLSKIGEFSSNQNKWFQNPVLSPSGRVQSIEIGDKTLTGEQIRNAFDLRSANFSVENRNDQFTFTVLGYGHGVGLSQFGANEMAKGGSSYKEILKHYYRGCEIGEK